MLELPVWLRLSFVRDGVEVVVPDGVLEGDAAD